MTDAHLPPPPPSADDRERQDSRPPYSAPVPFYRRPFFWVLMGVLGGAVLLALLLYSCQPAPRDGAAAPSAQPDNSSAKKDDSSRADKRADQDAALRDLLQLQRAQNLGLEEELRRLKQLLQEDPCALPKVLGAAPQDAPVAPGYSAPTPQAQPPADGDSTPAPTPAAAPSTVSKLMEQATVYVLSSYNGDVGAGSGFFVAPGIVATNRHVVQNPEAKVIVGNKTLGGMVKASVVAFSSDENHDFALLRVDNTAAAKAPVLRIKNGAERTERVSAWGFPGFITEIDPKLEALLEKGDAKSVPEVVYSEGVVSVVLDRKPPVILHTAALSQGNSGGPLINAEGVVVGINTFIRKADKSYMQTSIALSGETLSQFMSTHGITASGAGK